MPEEGALQVRGAGVLVAVEGDPHHALDRVVGSGVVDLAQVLAELDLCLGFEVQVSEDQDAMASQRVEDRAGELGVSCEAVGIGAEHLGTHSAGERCD